MIRYFLSILIIAISLLFSGNIYSQNFVEKSNYKYCNDHNFTYFFLDVYDIYLCSNNLKSLKAAYIYQDNFSIFIQYNMNFDREELSESSIKEINRYYDISQMEQQKYYQKLLNIFPNVKKTDIIEARYHKNGVTKFYHNKNLTGEIKNANFSKIFLDIWLHQDNKYQRMIKDLYQINDYQ